MVVLAFSFAWLVRSGHVEVWHAYTYVVISGTCLSVTQPMRQALIANTVPHDALGNAYAANVLTITGTRLVGPFFGGVLIATPGFFWNFAIESLLYVSMVLIMLPMATPYYEPRKDKAEQSLISDLKEGVLYIWRDATHTIPAVLLLEPGCRWPEESLEMSEHHLVVQMPITLGKFRDVLNRLVPEESQ